jgi:hypothetical protein
MMVASGSGPIVPMGPTETHIVAGFLIAVSALIVLGYYGTNSSGGSRTSERRKVSIPRIAIPPRKCEAAPPWPIAPSVCHRVAPAS